MTCAGAPRCVHGVPRQKKPPEWIRNIHNRRPDAFTGSVRATAAVIFAETGRRQKPGSSHLSRCSGLGEYTQTLACDTAGIRLEAAWHARLGPGGARKRCPTRPAHRAARCSVPGSRLRLATAARASRVDPIRSRHIPHAGCQPARSGALDPPCTPSRRSSQRPLGCCSLPAPPPRAPQSACPRAASTMTRSCATCRQVGAPHGGAQAPPHGRGLARDATEMLRRGSWLQARGQPHRGADAPLHPACRRRTQGTWWRRLRAISSKQTPSHRS